MLNIHEKRMLDLFLKSSILFTQYSYTSENLHIYVPRPHFMTFRIR